MARIITRLYKHHAHASLSACIERVIHEGLANPLPLVSWIHRQNIYLTHAVLWVQSSTHPTHQLIPLKRDGYVFRLTIKNSGHVAVLAFLPPQWVESLVNKARHRAANQRKHRLPGSQ